MLILPLGASIFYDAAGVRVVRVRENALGNVPLRHRVLVHMDVDKAGGDDFAGGVDFPVRVRHSGAGPENLTLFNQKIQHPVHPVGGVDDPAAINQSFQGVPPFRVCRNASSRSRPVFSSSSE